MRYYAPFPGGQPGRPRGPHALRIGDAERDAAAAELGEHYAAGRLTLPELNERLDEAFAARTFGELTRVMADLPGTLAGPVGLPRLLGTDTRPYPELYRLEPGSYRHDGYLGGPAGRWYPEPPEHEFHSAEPDEQPTAADRAGRLAALSLLLLAMLIWLFTALLFARHGIYHPGSPVVGPPGQQFGPYTQP